MEKEVKLKIQFGWCSWTVYTRGDWKYETFERTFKVGDKLDIKHFRDHVITEIADDHITLVDGDDTQILTREKPLHVYTEIEGREWSDGCVYDGDDYTTDVFWID